MNLAEVNKKIVDRSDLFYWQAERRVTEQEAAEIWKDRHAAIKNDELLKAVNKALVGEKCVSIDEVDPEKQEANGSVNSNRIGYLANGKKVIIRCHPRGVKNGYFHVESLAANLLAEHGLPTYHTYAIHDCENENDCAFQVIEKIEGIAVKNWLEAHPEDTMKLTYETGKMMRKMHALKVKGFGSFDNEKAKLGKLECLHNSLANFVNCGLKNNLETLVKYKTITQEQSAKILNLFSKDNPLLDCKQSVLIHNDFVDWNLLTDGNTITGILDLDECAGGAAVCDIASWSGMSSLERVEEFLKGYFEDEKPSQDFDRKLKLISFRWIISNMSLRNSRLEYMPDDKFLQSLIADGKEQMKFYMNYFNLGE